MLDQERLDRISGLLSDGKKCTVETLWLSVSKKRFAEHKLEEDAAFARLLSGYDAPQVGEIVSGISIHSVFGLIDRRRRTVSKISSAVRRRLKSR